MSGEDDPAVRRRNGTVSEPVEHQMFGSSNVRPARAAVARGVPYGPLTNAKVTGPNRSKSFSRDVIAGTNAECDKETGMDSVQNCAPRQWALDA